MKNTRKKMLLSSVAMLLVALVALGSATFAWFTMNKEVEANTINVKAATTRGLVINNKVSAEWKRTVSFSGEPELNPVSVDAVQGSNFPASGYYAKDVAASGAYVASPESATGFTQAAVKPALNDATLLMGSNSYAAAYKVQIKSSDDNAISKAVTAAITASGDGTTFAKACLVDSNGAIKASYGDGYNAITAATPTVKNDAYSATASAQVLSSVDANTTYDYTLYVWYEGNDADCIDTNQGKSTSFTITFTLAD